MGIICPECLKTVREEGAAFCPYCGGKLPVGGKAESRGVDAEKWLKQARETAAYPQKKKILQEGLAACPDSRDIRWELLFIGEEPPKKSRRFEFSVIKCWILQIYRKPEDFSAGRQDELRALLYDDPALRSCLRLFEDPAQKQREYLLRLCREYVEIFLEGDSQVMGNWFGFRSERNKAKKLAAPVADMIRRIKTDEKLLPEQREQLWKLLYQAYTEKTGGAGIPDDMLGES